MPAPDLTPLPATNIASPLHVHLHANHVTPDALAGGVVVIIDNLRASVTITAALFHGASRMIPRLTVEDALRARSESNATGVQPLLGGERGGVLIQGFDLDNSPLSYTRDRVHGRTVIFTTANGTAALVQSRLAARVLVGSFVNLSAVCDAVAEDPRPVHLLCCGTRDDVGLDDILPAGAMAERLIDAGRSFVSDDSGRVALLTWRAARDGGLEQAMLQSRGGRGLSALGLGGDLAVCTAIDSMPIVPEYDHSTGKITA